MTRPIVAGVSILTAAPRAQSAVAPAAPGLRGSSSPRSPLLACDRSATVHMLRAGAGTRFRRPRTPASRGRAPKASASDFEERAKAPEMDTSRFWVKVAVKDSVIVPVETECDPGAELATYMSLPVSQFTLIDLPLGSQLVREGLHEFRLTVPNVKIFFLEVQPQLTCRVTQETKPYRCVQIEADNCTLYGTDAICGPINRCFKFHVKTHFQWRDPASGVGAELLGGTGPAIMSTSEITVRLDPPPPFSFFPKELLETTGNAVMSASLAALQTTFIQNLAKDYVRWSTDAAYRAERAAADDTPAAATETPAAAAAEPPPAAEPATVAETPPPPAEEEEEGMPAASA